MRLVGLLVIVGVTAGCGGDEDSTRDSQPAPLPPQSWMIEWAIRGTVDELKISGADGASSPHMMTDASSGWSPLSQASAPPAVPAAPLLELPCRNSAAVRKPSCNNPSCSSSGLRGWIQASARTCSTASTVMMLSVAASPRSSGPCRIARVRRFSASPSSRKA